MSIVIRKKHKFNKKKLMQRVIALIFIYFASFSSMYAWYFHKKSLENQKEIIHQIHYANEGEQFYEEGKYAQSIEFFISKLNNGSENYKYMTWLAKGYKKLNETEKAKFYLFKSKDINPNYSENYIQLADIYLDEQKYDIAENAIEIIPTKDKNDFIEKANLLIKLAKNEPDVEDKLIHYARALNYLKKYDKKAYNINASNYIDLLFSVADNAIRKNDTKTAFVLFSHALKYKDDCITRNKLAIKYMNLSDIAIIKNITLAVDKAKTQDEKRMTKENIITLKYYFEKKGNADEVHLLSDLLDVLDESKILVDEQFTNFSVQDEEFKIIKEDKSFYPQLAFSVLNKSDKNIDKLYAKLEVYINPKKIIETETAEIIEFGEILQPNQKSKTLVLQTQDISKEKNLAKCNFALSLSKNKKDWKLYRLYNHQQRQK